MTKSVSLKKIHHVEIYAGNAKQASYYYRNVFGYDQIAYLGPETGHHDRASYVLKQGDIFLVVTSPLSHEDPMNIFLTIHGDSVKDIQAGNDVGIETILLHTSYNQNNVCAPTHTITTLLEAIPLITQE